MIIFGVDPGVSGAISILENKPINKGIDTNALEELKQQAMPDNKFDISFTPEEQEMLLGPKEEEEMPDEEPQQGFMSKPKGVMQNGFYRKSK